MDLEQLPLYPESMKATNPRDKLYALIGKDEVKDVTIIPDHTRSVSAVYSHFTVQYLQSKSILSVLHKAGIGLSGSDLSLHS
jgi:hypothetical protein